MILTRANNPRRTLYRAGIPDAGITFFAYVWLHVDRSDGLHRHAGDQLLALLDGGLVMEVDGRTLTLTPGDTLRIAADTLHHVLRSTHHRVARLMNFIITPGDTALGRETRHLPQKVLPVDLDTLRSIVDGLPAGGGGNESDLPTTMAAAWRLIAVVRAAADETSRQNTVQSLDPRIEVCEMLIHNLLDQSDLGADLLAERVRLSRSQLDRLYRRHFEQSPTDRIREIRIERARHLLLATAYSVKQIAGACGFGRAVNLTRAFREAHGCTPTQYRERISSVSDLQHALIAR